MIHNGIVKTYEDWVIDAAKSLSTYKYMRCAQRLSPSESTAQVSGYQIP